MPGMARLPAMCRIWSATHGWSQKIAFSDSICERYFICIFKIEKWKIPTDGSSLFVVCFGSLGGPLLERSDCGSAPPVLGAQLTGLACHLAGDEMRARAEAGGEREAVGMWRDN